MDSSPPSPPVAFRTRSRPFYLASSPLNPAATPHPIASQRPSPQSSPFHHNPGSFGYSPAPTSPLTFLTNTAASTPPLVPPPSIPSTMELTVSSALQTPRWSSLSPLRGNPMRQHVESRPRHIKHAGANRNEYNHRKSTPSPLEHLAHLWVPSPPLAVTIPQCTGNRTPQCCGLPG